MGLCNKDILYSLNTVNSLQEQGIIIIMQMFKLNALYSLWGFRCFAQEL